MTDIIIDPQKKFRNPTRRLNMDVEAIILDPLYKKKHGRDKEYLTFTKMNLAEDNPEGTEGLESIRQWIYHCAQKVRRTPQQINNIKVKYVCKLQFYTFTEEFTEGIGIKNPQQTEDLRQRMVKAYLAHCMENGYHVEDDFYVKDYGEKYV